jgi:hypothetical protein
VYGSLFRHPRLAAEQEEAQFLLAARVSSPLATSIPETFSFRGVPRIFAPSTTPAPSGNSRSALLSRDRSAGVRTDCITISAFGVKMVNGPMDPDLAGMASRMASRVCAIVMLEMCSPWRGMVWTANC